MALQRSNNDVGGKLIEMGETEFMVRGLGYIESIEDVEKVPVGIDENGTPILIRNIAHVHLGPELRRGLVDWNGEGETVAGIVVMRYGENALKTINAVKAKLEVLKKGPARRRDDSHSLRPQRADRTGHRQPEGEAVRREYHRRAGDHPFPAARPERVGGPLHPPGGHPDLLSW